MRTTPCTPREPRSDADVAHTRSVGAASVLDARCSAPVRAATVLALESTLGHVSASVSGGPSPAGPSGLASPYPGPRVAGGAAVAPASALNGSSAPVLASSTAPPVLSAAVTAPTVLSPTPRSAAPAGSRGTGYLGLAGRAGGVLGAPAGSLGSAALERAADAIRVESVVRSVANLGSGVAAGMLGSVATYPQDYAKTLLQLQAASAGPAVGAPGLPRFRGSLDVWRHVVRTDGAAGLWRGCVPQALSVGPEKAIKLLVVDAARSALRARRGDDAPLPLWCEVLAGVAGGSAQVLATNPGEIVKVRVQQQVELEASVPGYARKSVAQVCRDVGLRGMYEGALPCLLRDATFAGIFFPMYFSLRAALAEAVDPRSDPAADPPMAATLSAGLAAGTVAAALTCPLDTVKTAAQMARADAAPATLLGHARAVWRAGGLAAMFRGWVPRAARSGPQFAVTLVAYEALKDALVPPQQLLEE